MAIVSILEVGEWLWKHMRPRRVLLVVDDNAKDLLWLEMELKLAKLRYETAQTAEEALGIMRKMRFSAALIDIGLPGLAKRIRDSHPKTRIFFITGSTFVNLEPSVLLQIIRKPITAAVLREMIV